MLDELTPLEWEEWKLALARLGVTRGDLRAALNTKALEITLFKFLQGIGEPDLDIGLLMIGQKPGDVPDEDGLTREDPALSIAKMEMLAQSFRVP